MDPEIVSKTWVWYGIEDLYFGFSIEFVPHKPYALFAEIMGLEKILKGYLFYLKGSEYSELDNNSAKGKIEEMAKKWSHNIKNMLEMASESLDPSRVQLIRSRDFDGFKGQDLIRAVEMGYMESRYPTYRPFYEQFKIEGTEIYRDPLASSGITKFIYFVCREILGQLRKKVNLSELKSQFLKVYGHQEESNRFIIAFEDCL